jgi:hypothetical protein
MSGVQLGDHMSGVQLVDHVPNFCYAGQRPVVWVWGYLCKRKELPNSPKVWAYLMSGVQLGDHMSGVQLADHDHNFC